MAIKFEIPLSAVQALKDRLDSFRHLKREEAEQIGKQTVAAMKSLIASGTSPIEGKGKFAPYKHPQRYPGKRKAHSPVNLRLTGEMLDSLGYVVLPRNGKDGFAAYIGYDSVQSTLKESGHREGVNGQPRRPTLPNAGKGERFVSAIVEAYRKVVMTGFRKR